MKKTQSMPAPILDCKVAYHIGASIKDAGKKCFAITHLQEEALLHELLTHLKTNQ